ncbi:ectoine hydrolase DoeA [Yoonia sp. I 8.24]|uniref:ectoine hydrolase DoeA n=1 Tax=Yoonia sp. I 8.24 TaxID=1537229 RepID=UPI001EE135D7|nr:ectoine hydrolase DoeA [Yoonia sp. I 8.24]MCG3267275.1 ectoine hydrolase DoeA [Yoonia sp. I 8.24]
MNTLPFGADEYATRLHKVRCEMAARGMDALFVTDPSNMAWLTGYDGWSFYVHQGVLLLLEGDPIWWGRAMDAAGALRTTYLKADDIIGYDDTYVQNPDKHPMSALAQVMVARGLSGGRIGVEMDNYYFTAAAYHALHAGLGQGGLVDATALVNWQRAVKSETELSYMRAAARIVEKMHAVIREKAEPGMRKNDLIADIYHTAITGVDDYWGDYPAIVPMAPSGADATAPHLTWDNSPLKTGESTFFEISGTYRRYHCPQSRTLFLGKVPQKYLDAQAAVQEATAVGLEAARPGALCEDVANAFNSRLKKLGYEKDSRCGYAIGLSYPPDWGERTMSFRAGDKTVLEAGMTFHFMPALWLDDGGLETTESILITAGGAECLCATPSELVVKG